MPRPPARLLLLTILAALALAAAGGSLGLGPAHLGIDRTIAALAGRGDPVAATILFQLRLPRAILALLVGAMLGASGAALQGYLRNPLADPGVLGTANAGALGAVIAIYFGIAAVHPLALPALAIGGALVGLLPLLLLAQRAEGPLTLVLAGVAVGAAAGAGISLALNFAPNPFAMIEIMTWLMGSLADRSFAHVWIALPAVAIGLALVLWDARALDALTLGEDAAATLGTNLPAVRRRLALGVAIGVGGAVAVAGAIGFVGLVVPHLVRPLTDRRPSQTLLPSALAGAALLAFADLGVRLLPTSEEMKLGVVTSLVGLPIFFHQLLRTRRPW